MNWRMLKFSQPLLWFGLAAIALLILFNTDTLLQRVTAQAPSFNPWPSRTEAVPSYTIPPRGAYPGRRSPQDNYRLGPVQEVDIFETEHHLYLAPEPGKRRSEDAGPHTYYPGDYAVRMIDVVVKKKTT